MSVITGQHKNLCAWAEKSAGYMENRFSATSVCVCVGVFVFVCVFAFHQVKWRMAKTQSIHFILLFVPCRTEKL